MSRILASVRVTHVSHFYTCIPVQFNYVGKVIGPKGKTLQGLAKHFKCHFYVKGSQSTRDQAKEHELLMSGDPQHAHYAEPCHLEIVTTAGRRLCAAYGAAQEQH